MQESKTEPDLIEKDKFSNRDFVLDGVLTDIEKNCKTWSITDEYTDKKYKILLSRFQMEDGTIGRLFIKNSKNRPSNVILDVPADFEIDDSTLKLVRRLVDGHIGEDDIKRFSYASYKSRHDYLIITKTESPLFKHDLMKGWYPNGGQIDFKNMHNDDLKYFIDSIQEAISIASKRTDVPIVMNDMAYDRRLGFTGIIRSNLYPFGMVINSDDGLNTVNLFLPNIDNLTSKSEINDKNVVKGIDVSYFDVHEAIKGSKPSYKKSSIDIGPKGGLIILANNMVYMAMEQPEAWLNTVSELNNTQRTSTLLSRIVIYNVDHYLSNDKLLNIKNNKCKSLEISSSRTGKHYTVCCKDYTSTSTKDFLMTGHVMLECYESDDLLFMMRVPIEKIDEYSPKKRNDLNDSYTIRFASIVREFINKQ